MSNLYYKIWADAIVYEQKKHGHLRNWKFYTLIPISIIMGINLLTLSIIIGKIFGLWFFNSININISKIESLNSVVKGIVLWFLPFVILNYYFIFHKNKYEFIIQNYPDSKGKIYKWYVIGSLSIIIIPLIALVLFFQ